MIPIGYLYKRVFLRPGWLEAPQVEDIYSVSSCLSKSFADYFQFWRHNGYGLFDSPAVMRALAAEHSIPLDGLSLFYYEAHEAQYDEEEKRWMPFAPDVSFATEVEPPAARTLKGFDVVCFSSGTAPECSPLTCNGLAATVPTNRHGLLASLEAAVQALESGLFARSEPGPFRIIAVYSVETG
jgi:hypothetical protein